jgi:hypothetical protein
MHNQRAEVSKREVENEQRRFRKRARAANTKIATFSSATENLTQNKALH